MVISLISTLFTIFTGRSVTFVNATAATDLDALFTNKRPFWKPIPFFRNESQFANLMTPVNSQANRGLRVLELFFSKNRDQKDSQRIETSVVSHTVIATHVAQCTQDSQNKHYHSCLHDYISQVRGTPSLGRKAVKFVSLTRGKSSNRIRFAVTHPSGKE